MPEKVLLVTVSTPLLLIPPPVKLAELPEKVDNEDVRNQLLLLRTGTRELADLVSAQAADSVVSSRLTELHDTFHSIMEAWYHEGEHHKH